eukprot:CAMPEP_0113899742 /NCGR_PEP_ID=MMETSP0780_2-20120614/20236_1 /TAXON_ID=652834 /ORGANISM="Palpitomonas bilix" /LENGTH=102 /DNA_ID=CAMNT_0000892015 /DNA_START=146 /DNA_END=451 /DNA_ORIENTATION=+ /assembly_acc=CAM_ASM_000599
MEEEGGDVLTEEKLEEIEGLKPVLSHAVAVSFCRRMVVVSDVSFQLEKYYISVLYVDDSESGTDSKYGAEEEREERGKEEETKAPVSPTPPLVYPSVAYRTV